ELQTRLEQLRADRQRHHATDEKHDEREPQVQRADVLVVGRRDPAHDPPRMMRVLMVDAVTCGVIVRNAAHHLLLADLRRLLWEVAKTDPLSPRRAESPHRYGCSSCCAYR